MRWAIFGTGFISNTVADAIKGYEGAELSCVAGRRAEVVDAFAEAHGIPKRYHSYEEALLDDEIDAVYIGLPNHAHLPMVRAAAAAGKVILSEKSLTTSYADATALVAAVQDAGVFFVEGLMYLSHPLYAQFATLLRDPRLGEIRSINGVYAADIKDVVNAVGGGTLYNLGCYPASLLHFVVQQACGEESLRDYQIAAVGSLNSDGNICDTAAAFKFGNGVQATLQSTDSYGMHHSFEVMGTKGSLRFVTNPWLPSAGENIIEIAPYKGAVESVVVESGFDAFHHQIAMVEDCVARGLKEATRPSPRWSDSLAIMRFLTDWEAAVRG